jgi:uncharacterized protein (TIGR02444 family)
VTHLAESIDGSISGAQFKDGAQFATNRLDNPLWQYACQVYSQPGVEAALLDLQDEQGADINLILQALWLASERRVWTKESIPADYEKWMLEQVLPLRQMRRSMKTDWIGYEDFRQQVKKLELKAEQYALGILYESSQQEMNGEAGSVVLNLTLLAESSNIVLEAFDQLILLN